MVMVMTMVGTLRGLRLLLQRREGLLRTGQVAGLKRLADLVQALGQGTARIKLDRAIALKPAQGRISLLGRRQIARLERLRQLLK
jgi:hypothetical protein